jgi:recombination protein RecA
LKENPEIAEDIEGKVREKYMPKIEPAEGGDAPELALEL